MGTNTASVVALLGALGVGLAASCSSSDSETTNTPAAPEPGTERGACLAHNTCNAGLVCLSDLCVRLDSGAAGASGGAGTGGDAGVAGKAGSGGTTSTGGTGGAAGSSGTAGTGGASGNDSGADGSADVQSDAPAMQGTKLFGYITLYSMYHMLSGKLDQVEVSKLDYLVYGQIAVASGSDPTLTMFGGVPWTYLDATVTAAHGAGKKALVSLGAVTDLCSIVPNAGLRGQLVSNLVTLANTHGFDGIDIDWEEDPLCYGHADMLHTLITELYAQLHPAGKILTAYSWRMVDPFDIAIETEPYLELITLSRYVDPDEAGQFRPAMQLDNWAAQGWPKSKLFAGVPLYGWDSRNTTICTYADIINQFNPGLDVNSVAAPTVSSSYTDNSQEPVVGGTLFFSGVNRDERIENYVKSNGYGGLMFWEIGYDKLGDDRSVLRHMYDNR
jgi:hypothetical protein